MLLLVMDIVKLGSEVLRQKAASVDLSEIDNDMRKLLNEMFNTMLKANGVGLAAPQIGISKRFFVVIADDGVRRVFINPQIISTSPGLVDYDEGCLSIPGVTQRVKRAERVTIQSYNEHGKSFTLDANGLLARVILHEYDHLDGILFIDRLGEAKSKKITEKFLKSQAKHQKKV